MDPLTDQLRLLARVVITLAIVAAVIGQLPGLEIYRDANDCFGEALGRLFSAHGSGHASGCTSRPVLVRVEPAGGLPLLALLAGVVLGALAIWRWPRPLVAGLAALPTMVLVTLGALVTFDPEIFALVTKVPRWPAMVVGLICGTLALVEFAVLIGMPVVGIKRALRARRERRHAQPDLARARVLRDRS